MQTERTVDFAYPYELRAFFVISERRVGFFTRYADKVYRFADVQGNVAQFNTVFKFAVRQDIAVGVSYRRVERNGDAYGVLHKVDIQTNVTHIVEFPVGVDDLNERVENRFAHTDTERALTERNALQNLTEIDVFEFYRRVVAECGRIVRSFDDDFVVVAARKVENNFHKVNLQEVVNRLRGNDVFLACEFVVFFRRPVGSGFAHIEVELRRELGRVVRVERSAEFVYVKDVYAVVVRSDAYVEVDFGYVKVDVYVESYRTARRVEHSHKEYRFYAERTHRAEQFAPVYRRTQDFRIEFQTYAELQSVADNVAYDRTYVHASRACSDAVNHSDYVESHYVVFAVLALRAYFRSKVAEVVFRAFGSFYRVHTEYGVVEQSEVYVVT